MHETRNNILGHPNTAEASSPRSGQFSDTLERFWFKFGYLDFSSVRMAREADTESSPKDGTIVVAIVVPSVCVIVIIILLVTAFVLPKINGGDYDFALVKEERMKQRLEEIDSTIRQRSFYDWSRERSGQQSTPSFPSDPLCSICLDDFVHDAQIRGLRCSHVFHTQCLDEWFARFNEYCPLCHQAIIPGRVPAKRPNLRSDPIPVAYIV